MLSSHYAALYKRGKRGNIFQFFFIVLLADALLNSIMRTSCRWIFLKSSTTLHGWKWQQREKKEKAEIDGAVGNKRVTTAERSPRIVCAVIEYQCNRARRVLEARRLKFQYSLRFPKATEEIFVSVEISHSVQSRPNTNQPRGPTKTASNTMATDCRPNRVAITESLAKS